jgi:hypothetical protein
VTQFRGLQFTDFIINRGLMPGDSLLSLSPPFATESSR